MSSPAQDPRHQRGLGRRHGALGGSCHARRLPRAAVPCAEGLSLTWAEESGWHLPFQVPSKDLGLVWLPASCHWGETSSVSGVLCSWTHLLHDSPVRLALLFSSCCREDAEVQRGKVTCLSLHSFLKKDLFLFGCAGTRDL